MCWLCVLYGQRLTDAAAKAGGASSSPLALLTDNSKFDTTFVYPRAFTNSPKFSADQDEDASKYIGGMFEKDFGTGLIALKTTGDGNCLLHAVSRALWGVELFASQLRERLVQELVDHKDWYFQRASKRILLSDDKEAEWMMIVHRAKTNGQHLEFIHIFALANLLGRPIFMYANQYDLTTFGTGEGAMAGAFLPLRISTPTCKRPISLSWGSEFHGHFVPLVCVEGAEAAHWPALPVAFLTDGEVEGELLEQFVDFSEKIKEAPVISLLDQGKNTALKFQELTAQPGWRRTLGGSTTPRPGEEMFDVVVPVQLGRVAVPFGFDLSEKPEDIIARLLWTCGLPASLSGKALEMITKASEAAVTPGSVPPELDIAPSFLIPPTIPKATLLNKPSWLPCKTPVLFRKKPDWQLAEHQNKASNLGPSSERTLSKLRLLLTTLSNFYETPTLAKLPTVPAGDIVLHLVWGIIYGKAASVNGQKFGLSYLYRDFMRFSAIHPAIAKEYTPALLESIIECQLPLDEVPFASHVSTVRFLANIIGNSHSTTNVTHCPKAMNYLRDLCASKAQELRQPLSIALFNMSVMTYLAKDIGPTLELLHKLIATETDLGSMLNLTSALATLLLRDESSLGKARGELNTSALLTEASTRLVLVSTNASQQTQRRVLEETITFLLDLVA